MYSQYGAFGFTLVYMYLKSNAHHDNQIVTEAEMANTSYVSSRELQLYKH